MPSRDPSDSCVFPTILMPDGPTLNGEPFPFEEFETVIDMIEQDYRRSLEDAWADER